MKSTSIRHITARQVLDCKSKPMVEVDVYTQGGAFGRASSPSGVSAGIHEAFVLRDNDPSKFAGLSVFKAVEYVKNEIEPALLGMDILDQRSIDETLIALDGTEDKHRLGSNTIFSVSLACVRAAADTLNMPLSDYLCDDPVSTLPLPTYGFISGGSYQKNTMPFQECSVVPYKAQSIMEMVEIGFKIDKALQDVLRERTGQEPVPVKLCGWQAPDADPVSSFAAIQEAAERCGVADKIAFAIDCASSENYNEQTGKYDFVGKEISTDEMIEYLQRLCEQFNFLYIEDPLHEDDWDGWVKANAALTRTVLIGDDLTVTNKKRLERGFESKAIGGFIFKPNQVGTITESIDALLYAKEKDMLCIPSARAGGVIDDVMLDMAVAFGCACTKQGPPTAAECIYGINFLSRAEDLYPVAKPFDFTPLANKLFV